MSARVKAGQRAPAKGLQQPHKVCGPDVAMEGASDAALQVAQLFQAAAQARQDGVAVTCGGARHEGAEGRRLRHGWCGTGVASATRKKQGLRTDEPVHACHGGTSSRARRRPSTATVCSVATTCCNPLGTPSPAVLAQRGSPHPHETGLPPLTLLHHLLHRVQPRLDRLALPQRLAHPAAQQAAAHRRLQERGSPCCQGACAGGQACRMTGWAAREAEPQHSTSGHAPERGRLRWCCTRASPKHLCPATAAPTCVWSRMDSKLPLWPPSHELAKISSCLHRGCQAGAQVQAAFSSHGLQSHQPGQPACNGHRRSRAAEAALPSTLPTARPPRLSVLALSRISCAVAQGWKEAPRRSTACRPKGFK